AAQETLKFHEARRSDTHIVAPFAGLIVKRQRDQGDVVVPGIAMLTLISTEQLWISAWVDETEMDRLKPQLPARVVFRSEPTQSWPGQVARLGREADREPREFVVDVLVDELPRNWAVGQRAEVYIETDRREDVVVLPAENLLKKAGQSGVYVRVGDHAEWRPVSIGLRSAEALEITDGLELGDVVLRAVDGKSQSLAGRRVKVQ
ncbi:MAG: efflux RND transporter periplasmic adaptor subunit, partial [Planctomycetaceae bacterium]